MEKKVEVKKNDIDFILKNLQLPKELKEKLQSVTGHAVYLTKDEADKIRDMCGDRLMIHGFDKDYELTEEGKILEDLIDRLYIK